MPPPPRSDDDLEARLQALAAVPPPAALSEDVLAQIDIERRRAPMRWTLAAASFAVWGVGLQQLVAWTAAQLASAI
jgi:lysozyme family protein